MEKEFVPYEESLEMKELGFDGKQCMRFYNAELSLENTFLYSGNVGAPLWQQAFRWFREKYSLYHEIQLDQTSNPKFCVEVIKFTEEREFERVLQIEDWGLYRTYEEAQLACLRELIKIVKDGKAKID